METDTRVWLLGERWSALLVRSSEIDVGVVEAVVDALQSVSDPAPNIQVHVTGLEGVYGEAQAEWLSQHLNHVESARRVGWGPFRVMKGEDVWTGVVHSFPELTQLLTRAWLGGLAWQVSVPTTEGPAASAQRKSDRTELTLSIDPDPDALYARGDARSLDKFGAALARACALQEIPLKRSR